MCSSWLLSAGSHERILLSTVGYRDSHEVWSDSGINNKSNGCCCRKHGAPRIIHGATIAGCKSCRSSIGRGSKIGRPAPDVGNRSYGWINRHVALKTLICRSSILEMQACEELKRRRQERGFGEQQRNTDLHGCRRLMNIVGQVVITVQRHVSPLWRLFSGGHMPQSGIP